MSGEYFRSSSPDNSCITPKVKVEIAWNVVSVYEPNPDRPNVGWRVFWVVLSDQLSVRSTESMCLLHMYVLVISRFLMAAERVAVRVSREWSEIPQQYDLMNAAYTIISGHFAWLFSNIETRPVSMLQSFDMMQPLFQICYRTSMNASELLRPSLYPTSRNRVGGRSETMPVVNKFESRIASLEIMVRRNVQIYTCSSDIFCA